MTFEILDLGRMPYGPCVEVQRELLESVAEGSAASTLIFVEHDPVMTLGASFHKENLLLTPEEYAEKGIEIAITDRGGDVTYHGPGQLVAYPIFALTPRGKDLHRWLRDIEAAIIWCLADFGIQAGRFPPHTGVWVEEEKICAIGIKVRKWVSMHGLALNCDNDLWPFETIVPCGIGEYGVTSISLQTGRRITVEEVKPVLSAGFRSIIDGVS